MRLSPRLHKGKKFAASDPWMTRRNSNGSGPDVGSCPSSARQDDLLQGSIVKDDRARRMSSQRFDLVDFADRDVEGTAVQDN